MINNLGKRIISNNEAVKILKTLKQNLPFEVSDDNEFEFEGKTTLLSLDCITSDVFFDNVADFIFQDEELITNNYDLIRFLFLVKYPKSLVKEVSMGDVVTERTGSYVVIKNDKGLIEATKFVNLEKDIDNVIILTPPYLVI